MDFEIVYSFNNYMEAHIVMGRMEEEGIKCWLKDENTITIDPILTNAIGGIKLMVAADQKDNAMMLLSQFEKEKRANYSCPQCASHNIEFVTTPRNAVNWLSAIGSWLLGSYALGAKQVWHCFDCNAEFKEPVELKGEQELNED